ncbi:MAG: isoprenylcysteine carboxylmethyltransferase family protein [Bradyrhizobiaceae bacterium]|nr:isoprenylcysteine carboxylmethyltransferase family protein [Bradyrhizobiaceae bacterium]
MIATERSPIDLAYVQHVRKAVLLALVLVAVALVVLGESRWPSDGTVHETIEWAGLFLILLCILGRTWSSLYIGGRKVRSLVMVGPYSVSRNPLYVFSIIGAAGVGAQFGSVVAALAAGIAAWLVFYLVVLKEERVLTVKFGNAYRQYLAQVPRFFPRFSLWRDVALIEVKPRDVLRTFVDASVFLIAIPIVEGFEYLHEIGALPVFFHLP